ncbi:MAG: ABC transporter permease [Actinomycetota bacterium]|nr:ABC transporter permease [Actinomycetota bacterium]
MSTRVTALRLRLQRLGLLALAMVFGLAVAGVVVAGLFTFYDASLGDAVSTVVDYGTRPSSLVSTLNKSVTYYLAGLGAAIGFKMLLFNIGIDGQYRMAVFFAAVAGAAVDLPPVLHVTFIIAVAVMVGGAWAGIAGYLKVSRGVSEVISTIMLNAVASGIVAYLLAPGRFGEDIEGSNNIQTPEIPTSGWMPGFTTDEGVIYGFVVFAAILGVVFAVVLNRTRFGFDLRSSGMSLRAAAVSGVNSKRMVLVTMILSGALAGLIGLPELLGSTHRYALSFPAGLGYTGLSIALIGRNNPIGMAFAAFAWAWLERSAQPLDLIGVPKEVVTIVQGVVLVAVVVAYEVIRRISTRREQRLVGASEAEGPGDDTTPSGAPGALVGT